MTELTMVYIYFGLVAYAIGYLLVSFTVGTIFGNWAWKQVGEFWEYTYSEGLKAYFPNYWDWMRASKIRYSILYIGLWPIMIPLQTVIDVKAIRRVMFRGYHF